MKKRIKEIIIITTAVLLIAGSGYSQGRQVDPEERAKRNTEAMKERLELSEKQYKKVESINLEASKKVSLTIEEAAGDRETMRSKMTDINKETNKQLKEVLTDDQWKEYLVMQEEQRQRRQGRGN